jgi:hypothetical protein
MKTRWTDAAEALYHKAIGTVVKEDHETLHHDWLSEFIRGLIAEAPDLSEQALTEAATVWGDFASSMTPEEAARAAAACLRTGGRP